MKTEPILIGAVALPVGNSFLTVAWIAISDKNLLTDNSVREAGYIYGVLETLFSQNPLFSSGPCCWREADWKDCEVWEDSNLPTIYVY